MGSTTDKYRVWKPPQELPLLNFVSLTDDRDGFRVVTTPYQAEYVITSHITFHFKSVYAYRNIDESHRIGTQALLREQGVDSSNLYIVEPSSWLEWFFEEKLIDLPWLKHFAIYTADDYIDVITPSEPTITVSNPPS